MADQSTTDKAKHKAEDVAHEAQSRAQDALARAEGPAKKQARQRSAQAGQRLDETGKDLRSVSDKLKEQGNDNAAQMADQLAGRVERAGSYLQNTSPESMYHDLEDLARKNPWAFAAGGLVLGLAASRFIKASSVQERERRRRESDYEGYSGRDYGVGGDTANAELGTTAYPADYGRGPATGSHARGSEVFDG